MIASAAVALLAAMGIRIGITFVRNRRLAAARVRALLPVLLFGIAVQGLWMHRQPAPLEWSVPGYPRSYLSQLMLKNGNDPELGMATLREIPVRVVHNALDDTGLLGQVLLHRGIDEAWMSAAVVGPLLLILLGWGYSVWPSGGGLHDWYFAAYELIYLLWPWRLEPRFFFPECGNEVFPTNSTAGLLLLVEWRASGRFFGKEQAPLARCRMAAGVRGAGDRCLVLDTGIWDRPAHATWRPARRDLIPDVVALGDCRGVDGMGEFRLVGPNLSLAAMFFPPARSPANNSDARLTTPRRSRGNRPDYNGTGAADRTRARQHESQFRRELGPGGC